MELSWLSWLYEAVAFVITWIHTGYATFLNPDSGLTWALTIITLTVLMRICIFPLFLKQMRSPKKMQELAPPRWRTSASATRTTNSA
ncbi:YidC/Oxa1 family membrane protein insertase [Nonomuraea ferruginea]